jgi:hypothetical protein
MKPSTSKKIKTIPNTLNIVINTSIPGFQTIKYKTNMTIPDFKSDNIVAFDPLVKLEKKIIDKIPEEFRVKEFFNRGLFNSLINLHGMKRVPSLEEAVYYGYVDNNIKLTLDILFPVNGLIYINKEPYRIADIQWRKGDWRITPKVLDMPKLDPTKVRDPFLYQSIIQDDLISGEEQLSELPDNVVFGPNYNIDSDPTAIGRKKKEEVIQEEKEKIIPLKPIPVQAPLLAIEPSKEVLKEKQTLALPPPPVRLALPAPPPTEKLALPAPQVQQPLALPAPQVKQPLALPASPPTEKLALPAPTQETTIDIIPPEDKRIQEIESYMHVPTPDIVLKGSSVSTEKIRNLFKNIPYYTMLSNIFTYISDKQKEKIKESFLAPTTSVKIKPKIDSFITYDAYKKSLEYLHVYSNSGGGDCFFIAVADGINYYNHRNPNNRIKYKQYGIGTKIFTQMNLREVLADYILSDNFNYDDVDSFTYISLEEINNAFLDKLKEKKNELKRDLNENEYMSLINNIYLYNDNFLIDKPTKMPSDENSKNQPFTVLPKEKVREYVSSSYCQGNVMAVKAMSKMLGLNIIPLGLDRSKKLEIPFSNFLDTDWTKYLFLYYTQGEMGHYELIGFDYNIQIDKTIIFEKESRDIYPPVYILYMIFSCSYLPMGKESQDSFELLNPLFNGMKFAFNMIYKNIESTVPDVKNRSILFFRFFEKIFNLTNNNLVLTYPLLTEINKMELIKPENETKLTKTQKLLTNLPETILTRSKTRKLKDLQQEPKKGGQGYYTTPYNVNPYNVNPYYRPNYNQNIENLTRKENDKSDLSYYIEIDMELKRGKEPLTSQEIRALKCDQKWNSVRRAYAEFTGKKYVIPPVYDNISQKKTQKQKIGGKKRRTLKR